MPGDAVAFSDLKPGDGVLVDNHGIHPAVVLRVADDSVVVICGTGTRRRDFDFVEVKPRSRAAMAMGLHKSTYFYPAGVAVIQDAGAIQKKTRRCPPNIFHKLEALAASSQTAALDDEDPPVTSEDAPHAGSSTDDPPGR